MAWEQLTLYMIDWQVCIVLFGNNENFLGALKPRQGRPLDNKPSPVSCPTFKQKNMGLLFSTTNSKIKFFFNRPVEKNSTGHVPRKHILSSKNV